MLSLLRYLISILSLIFGWITSSMVIVLIIWGGWELFSVYANLLLEWLNIPSGIRPPPPLNHLLILSAAAALGFVVLHGILFSCKPIKSHIKAMFPGCAVERLDSGHPLTQTVSVLAGKMGVDPPSVWITGAGGINAMVMALPGRQAVILHAGAFQALTPSEISWVIAHELGHIRHGDASALTFWTLGLKGVMFGQRLKEHFILFSRVLVGNLAGIVPLLGILLLPLQVLSLVTSLGWRLAIWTFCLLDRAVGRQMEYRCDADACRIASAETAVSLLEKIPARSATINPLWATHPSRKNRIKRVKQLQKRDKK